MNKQRTEACDRALAAVRRVQRIADRMESTVAYIRVGGGRPFDYRAAMVRELRSAADVFLVESERALSKSEVKE